MVIFNSYVKLPEGNPIYHHRNLWFFRGKPEESPLFSSTNGNLGHRTGDVTEKPILFQCSKAPFSRSEMSQRSHVFVPGTPACQAFYHMGGSKKK